MGWAKLAGQTMDKALAATTNEQITETTNGQYVTHIISSWAGHHLLVGWWGVQSSILHTGTWLSSRMASESANPDSNWHMINRKRTEASPHPSLPTLAPYEQGLQSWERTSLSWLAVLMSLHKIQHDNRKCLVNTFKTGKPSFFHFCLLVPPWKWVTVTRTRLNA